MAGLRPVPRSLHAFAVAKRKQFFKTLGASSAGAFLVTLLILRSLDQQRPDEGDVRSIAFAAVMLIPLTLGVSALA